MAITVKKGCELEDIELYGYARISVDEELDRDNTSIENQFKIIDDYCMKNFPNSKINKFKDRDRSGYTFEQREDYQEMRKRLFAENDNKKILIVKDFSRFSRRNSRGLVELEDLRDKGVRIISIGDCIDYPTYDDWTNIQFRFLVNEMPVTDTSKKVKAVIRRKQNEGKWICSVPYGYVITNSKTMTFEIDEPSAEVVRQVFHLYNEGWGYKKIANYLTEQNIPTPRMIEKMRIEAKGETCKHKIKPEWSIVTISDIIVNDFYIGTLRQGKYTRKKINGTDVRIDEKDHIVFENNHDPIIDYKTFAIAQENYKKRSVTHYRGIKKYDNVYTGFLYCGDCGEQLFSMSRGDLKPAYTCSSYHKRGLKGCTSHHTRVDILDKLLKIYIQMVRNRSKDMIAELEKSIKDEPNQVKDSTITIELLQSYIDDAKSEMKMLTRQKAREIMKSPQSESIIEETYQEMLDELVLKIEGLKNQMYLTIDKQNTVYKVNRIAKTALDIFNDILDKDKLDKIDLELIIDKIIVYENHIEINLKNDISNLLAVGSLENTDSLKTNITQKSTKRKDKVFNVNVVSKGEPLEIFTDKEGEVILKKYSPIGELGDFANQYAEALAKTSGHIVCIADRDTIISVSGGMKKDFLDKRISAEIENIIEDRSFLIAKSPSDPHVPVTSHESGEKIMSQVVVSIVAEGDPVGVVILLSTDPQKIMGEVELKLAQSASSFLGKQMEQ